MIQEEQLAKMFMDMQVNIASLNCELKANAKQIEEQKELTETVQRLALSMERLIAQMEQTTAQVGNLRQDIELIKERPGKRWESIVAAFITSLIAFLIGRFL